MAEERQVEDLQVGHVLGIDVGWSENVPTTGACLLGWTPTHVKFEVYRIPTEFNQRRAKLAEVVGSRKFRAVALDGPLRRGFDRIEEYRLAELLLTRRFSNAGFGKPGQSSSSNGIMLNEHANQIAKAVVEAECVMESTHQGAIHDLAIVEAFPTTFLAVMLDEGRRPSSKAKSDIFYEWLLGPNSPCRHTPDENRVDGLIRRLLPDRTIEPSTATIMDHEHRAAVVCALTAMCVARQQYVAVGDSRNGYIILPPRSEPSVAGMQPWAMTMILANAKEATDWEVGGLEQKPPSPHIVVADGQEVSLMDAAVE
jgi:predicted RNase H-like nuclease